MGFKSVYRTLQELFPQVDPRLLKAAAIEHSKDPDGAVDFILNEVIPSKMEKVDATSALNRTLGSPVKHERQFSLAFSSYTEHDATAAFEEAIGSEVIKAPQCTDPPCLNERVQNPLGSTFYDAKDCNDQLSGYAGCEELTTSKRWEKTLQNISVFPIMGDLDDGDCSREPKNIISGESSKLQKCRNLDFSSLPALSTSSILEDAVSDISLSKSNDNAGFDCDTLLVDSCITAHTESQKKQLNFDSDSFCGPNYVELALLSAKDHALESLNCSTQSKVGSVKSDSKLEISESRIEESSIREDIQVLDNTNTGESSRLDSVVTQSGHVCNTDTLENIIEESKGHQERLLSDMISVLNLIKEVESEENAAVQAKKETGNRGLEIHARVEELKIMLNRAKEANDMHSREVYGERAILATEMKELQSRLLSMSDLKENSVSVLGVIRKTLEARLAAAEKEKKAAEEKAYREEESDRNAVAELEVQMAKMLQKEAEENAKLREFLMDRGHVVDMLQAEICIIYQDVKLLEEQLDNRVPLNQLFCLSSGSAQKSTESEQLLKHDMPSTLSVEPILLPSAEQTTAITQNELLDEGWELFEDAAQD